MANSKYEYVRTFERDEVLLPNTWVVVRVDGRGFHRLSNHYKFIKPNDPRALNLMNEAARHVVRSLPDVVVAYGVSDEYSFVFHRSMQLFERRAAKVVSTVVSSFTAAYVFLWGEWFGGGGGGGGGGDDDDDGGDDGDGEKRELDLTMLPTFDGRAVMYPGVGELRDYLCWRQVDCHINNLYNTTFWAMVQLGGLTAVKAEEELKGTVAADKNEILWSRYGINYNNEPEMYKKGSVVFREYALEEPGHVGLDESAEMRTTAVEDAPSKTQQEKMKKARQKARVVVEHLDIIKDDFWKKRPWILSGRPGKAVVANNVLSS